MPEALPLRRIAGLDVVYAELREASDQHLSAECGVGDDVCNDAAEDAWEVFRR